MSKITDESFVRVEDAPETLGRLRKGRLVKLRRHPGVYLVLRKQHGMLYTGSLERREDLPPIPATSAYVSHVYVEHRSRRPR